MRSQSTILNQGISTSVIDLLKIKYNILDIIQLAKVDGEFDILKQRLGKIQKTRYDQHEKILITHHDTDFYFEYCSVGINLLNFFTVVESLDIPRSVFIFYTNHFGIQKEINQICKDPNDRPGVIQSILSNYSYSPDGYRDLDLALNEIKHQALCMSNLTRSHRFALYNVINNLSDEQILKSFTVNK